jgi:NodT family efflux transporter outer membrane factor (OMF) lipoprotein
MGEADCQDCQNCQNRRDWEKPNNQMISAEGPQWVKRPASSICAKFCQSNFLLFLFLTGCAVGPNYHRPSAPSAPAWKEQPPWRVARPTDGLPKGEWWAIFGDSQLDEYELQAMAANQTIDVARNQLEQSRDSVRIAQSGLFPQLSAGAAAERSRGSRNAPTVTGTRLSTAATQNNLQIPFILSWEPDVFGGVRRGAESANAQYQSSAAALENVRLVVTSDLATDYFSLRELDAEIEVVTDAVEYQQKALQLVQRRHDGGIASGLDVAQQETQLNATRSQATLLRRQRAQFEHAIAALIGVPASIFSIAVKPLTLEPPRIPTGIPSDVLERRPDVAQAERLVASENAQIGVAKSAYYPSIGILGTGGAQSTDVTSLISAPSAFWAIGATVTQSLLTGGRRRAQLDFANAGYRASVASYRQTVLTAFQEVEDGISGLSVLADAAQTQQQAVDAAQRALNIATDRYVGGLVTYLDVVTAEQTLLDNKRLATQILGQQLTTSVSLVKSLGGGWDAASLQTIQVKTSAGQGLRP